MSRVGASLTMKVHARVAGIVGRGVLIIPFALETLVSGPGLDQRAVDREMLVGEQSLGTRLLDHRGYAVNKKPVVQLGAALFI